MQINAEGIEQIKVVEYLKQKHPKIPFIHIANERQCDVVYGRILKRMGVRKGVSDLFFPRSNKTFKGLWIELKTPTGKVSPSQLEFINEMIEEGYAAHVAYGAEEGIKMIKNFYYLED
jgi:hypothetical protein